jgi:hypothetical protein
VFNKAHAQKNRENNNTNKEKRARWIGRSSGAVNATIVRILETNKIVVKS